MGCVCCRELNDSQRSGLLLGEDPDEEVGLLVGLEGGGDQQVFSGRQREALGHLPHVDVGLAASLGRVVAEEVFVCVVFAARSLNGREEKRWIRIDALGSALSISMKQQEGRTFVFLSD